MTTLSRLLGSVRIQYTGFVLGFALALLFLSLSLPAFGKNTRQSSIPAKPSSDTCANPEADEFIRRGRKEWPQPGPRTPAVIAAAGMALTYFQLAVEKDPKCPAAYLSLAQAYASFPSWPALPPDERYAKAKAAASKALALDEGLTAAHVLLGRAEFDSWHWELAEKEFKRALQLTPNDTSAHASYARFLAAVGRSEEAIAEIELARKLARGSSLNAAAGEIYYWARRYDQAIELLRPTVEIDPFAYFPLGWAYVAQSRWPEAIGAFEKLVPLSDRDAGSLMSLAYA
jgi:tetratricopeptide (TPR) repeat protein